MTSSAPRYAAQEAHQPLLGVDVEVVRRLVEAQHVAAGEQDAGQLDAPALATGQHADRVLDAARADAEPGGQGAGLAVGGVPAVRAELLLGAGVAGDVALVGQLLHGDAQLLDALELGVDARARTGCGRRRCGRRGRRRCAGPAAGSRTRPCGRTRPAAGSASPPSTRNRLVLPAPLRPTRPTLSRGMTVKSADSTTSRPPTSTESACAWSTGPGCQARCGVPTTLRVRRRPRGAAVGRGGDAGLVGVAGRRVGAAGGRRRRRAPVGGRRRVGVRRGRRRRPARRPPPAVAAGLPPVGLDRRDPVAVVASRHRRRRHRPAGVVAERRAQALALRSARRPAEGAGDHRRQRRLAGGAQVQAVAGEQLVGVRRVVGRARRPVERAARRRAGRPRRSAT